MSALKSFLAELRRRHVVRVAVVYVAVAWALVEATATIFPTLGLPAWSVTLVVVLVGMGFPLALVLAWALELTPNGVRPTEPVVGSPRGARSTRSRAGLAWLALLLVVGLTAWLVSRRLDSSARPGRIQSIAVLPFSDMSPESDEAYLGQGLAEEISNALFKIDGLRVASPISARGLSETATDAREIGRRLGVEAVLEGSVRKWGDSLRITAQLISATDNFHLWSETFDRQSDSIFAVQEGIARSVVDVLGYSVPGQGRMRLADEGTSHPEAHDLYLRGRVLLGKRNVEPLTGAVEYFRKAIAEDSTYAKAYAGLAESYFFLARAGAPVSDDWMEQAEALIATSLRLDPNLADGYAARSLLQGRRGDWRGALASLRTAIALNPRHADAATWIAWHLMNGRGDIEEALVWAARAYELDSFSFVQLANYAFLLALNGDRERALEISERNARLNADVAQTSSGLAELYLLTGRDGDALDSARRAVEIAMNTKNAATRQTWVLCKAAIVLAEAGESAEARGVLERAAALGAPPFALGLGYGALGEMSEAYRLLEQGGWTFGDRAGIEFDDLNAPLREDPRWPALIARMIAELGVDPAPS